MEHNAQRNNVTVVDAPGSTHKEMWSHTMPSAERVAKQFTVMEGHGTGVGETYRRVALEGPRYGSRKGGRNIRCQPKPSRPPPLRAARGLYYWRDY